MSERSGAPSAWRWLEIVGGLILLGNTAVLGRVFLVQDRTEEAVKNHESRITVMETKTWTLSPAERQWLDERFNAIAWRLSAVEAQLKDRSRNP